MIVIASRTPYTLTCLVTNDERGRESYKKYIKAQLKKTVPGIPFDHIRFVKIASSNGFYRLTFGEEAYEHFTMIKLGLCT